MTKRSGKHFGIQRRPYVVAMLVAGIVAVTSFGIFTLLKSLYPKSNSAKADTTIVNTGKGRVTAVELTQVGTGASVTIDNSDQTVDGKSLDENTYGTNTTRRTVLNNNIVRYRVKYEVTSPGTVTLKFTMPANSVIDKASIAGCADGSKMASATTDNLHADINKGWSGYSEAGKPEESHSYNQAICVMNYDMAGAYTWDISTRPWGGNGEKIVPEVSFNDTSQTATAKAITIVARAKYSISWSGSSMIMGDGGNGDAKLSFILASAKTDDYSLGMEPLGKNISISYKLTAPIKRVTSNKRTRIVDGALIHGKVSQGVQWDVAYSGVTSVKFNNNDALVELSDVVTGASSCETRYNAEYCVQGEYDYDFYFDLTYEKKDYSQVAAPVSTLTRSSLTTKLTTENFSQNETLYKHGEANPFAWYEIPAAGQESACMYGELGSTCPVYRGEALNRMVGLNGVTVPDKSYAEDNYFCITWNRSDVVLNSGLSMVDADTQAEYGTISSTVDVLPSSNKQSCGVYGDGNTSFAKELVNKTNVNAIRLLVPKIDVVGGQRRVASYTQKIVSSREDAMSNKEVYFLISGHSPDWSTTRDGKDSDDPHSWLYSARPSVIVPGLLTIRDLDVLNSRVYPANLTSISITPITYNNDKDAKMTISLPKGLSFIDGSLKQNESALSANNYTVSTGSDGTTRIVITGSSIAGSEPTETKDANGNIIDVTAADNDGKGISHAPITLSVRADVDVVTPQTLPITVTTSGNGTDMTMTDFHQKSIDISVVESKTFTYGLSASADSVYSGDGITYTANIRNSLDEATNDDGANFVNVLPYNGDSRGTTGLDGYNIKDISFATTNTGSGDAPTADIYYSTSLDDAKKIDSAKDATAMKSAVDDTKWTKCELNGGRCSPQLADGEKIRAIKIKTGKLSKHDSVIMRYTLGDIYSTNATLGDNGTVATIGNDVAYMAASLIDTGVHTFGGQIADLGDQIGLSLDRTSASLSVKPGETSTATIAGKVNAKVAKGYTFTATPSSEMASSTSGHSFKKLNAEPTTYANGYNIKVNGGTASADWLTAANYVDEQPRGQYNRTYTTAFTAAPSFATPADTYTGKITYTLTAGI